MSRHSTQPQCCGQGRSNRGLHMGALPPRSPLRSLLVSRCTRCTRCVVVRTQPPSLHADPEVSAPPLSPLVSFYIQLPAASCLLNAGLFTSAHISQMSHIHDPPILSLQAAVYEEGHCSVLSLTCSSHRALSPPLSLSQPPSLDLLSVCKYSF